MIDRWTSRQDRAEAAPGHKARSSLLARAASRALLARHTGRADWRIERDSLGKPFVLSPTGAPGPAVSLSHTGETVAVAVAGAGALGVDIERHRRRDFAALAAQAFGVEEQAEVAREGADAFYRIWTLREAMAKATGEGLSLAANGRDLVAGGGSESYRRIEAEGRVWHLAWARPDPALSVAVAHADAGGEEWVPTWNDLGEPAERSAAFGVAPWPVID